jgi:hypothetical protein
VCNTLTTYSPETAQGLKTNWGIDGFDLVTESKMKQEIEVGDIIKSKGYTTEYTVSGEKEGEGYLLAGGTGWIAYESAVLVSKKAKQEIIGYELLKDLPVISAGAKGVIKNGKVEFAKGAYTFDYTFTQGHCDTNTEWFKPIYKAKEVVVKISKNREVKLDKAADKVSFGDGVEYCSFSQFNDIYLKITKTDRAHTYRMPYAIEILNFKLGCQEFTREDVNLIQKAIQGLK